MDADGGVSSTREALAGVPTWAARRIAFALRSADLGEYVPVPADSGGSEVPKPGITEAQLQAAIAHGARIRRVLVVYRRPDQLADPRDKPFIPCVRFAGTREWCVLRTQRGKASRGFASFEAMLGYLADRGWRGRTWVLAVDDPLIARLPGITDL
ncbi:hypothetical protein [Paracraurococcus lichenis]|uniref:Transposase n=1 Tax=Paracraurococcus lichenis TaxID=3064888 RepID=A0ABT9EAF3_9PROT|nr:hypothetical protein [Paracraurococcus sp. LOR1-02]MDO9713186.1 hypothetical protein [Paracraurococcus sp. LOR1-02]